MMIFLTPSSFIIRTGNTVWAEIGITYQCAHRSTAHLGQREALVGVAPARADDHVPRPLAAQHQLPLVARQLGAGEVRDVGIGDAGDHLLHSQAQNTCK